ncbi:hypothetical protein LINGRAHAP2_LOCUS30407, partial [Linum grandiflorum]
REGPRKGTKTPCFLSVKSIARDRRHLDRSFCKLRENIKKTKKGRSTGPTPHQSTHEFIQKKKFTRLKSKST